MFILSIHNIYPGCPNGYLVCNDSVAELQKLNTIILHYSFIPRIKYLNMQIGNPSKNARVMFAKTDMLTC